MKNQDTYTYKQILLGLRAELLRLNKELDKLKEYTTSNKHIQNYYFNLWTTTDLTPELYLFAEKETNIISFLKKQLGYQNTTKTSIMTKGNNGLYHITYPKNQQTFINFTNKEKFIKLANEILDSQIAKKMPIYNIIYGLNAKLTLNFYQLYINLKQFGKIFQMTYLGREDILQFHAALTHSSVNTKIILTQEILDNILNTKFPKEKFSDYHQKIIENNTQNFDIIIKEKPLYNLIQINENQDKLILTKRKK